MISKFVAATLLSFATLTAYPAIIAKVEFKDGGVLLFTDEQRKCPENTLAIEYIYPDKRKIGGCYMATPRGLYVVDDEGDQGTIPYEVLQKPDEA